MTNTEFLEQLSLIVNGLARVGQACTIRTEKYLSGQLKDPKVSNKMRVYLSDTPENDGYLTDSEDNAAARKTIESQRTPLSLTAVSRSLIAFETLTLDATMEQRAFLLEMKGKEMDDIRRIVLSAVKSILTYTKAIETPVKFIDQKEEGYEDVL